MALVAKNGLGYFFRGVRDSFYGFYRLYLLHYDSSKPEEEPPEPKHTSMLARRRALERNAAKVSRIKER